MKDESVKIKFVEMRVQNKSFDEIARALNVSKQTLLNWNDKFKKDIRQLKLINYYDLLQKYNQNDMIRLETLLKLKKTAMDELSSRSFKDVKTIDLINIIRYLDDEINSIRSVKTAQIDKDVIGNYEGINYEQVSLNEID